MGTITATDGQLLAIPSGWHHRLVTTGGARMRTTWAYLRWSLDDGTPMILPAHPVVISGPVVARIGELRTQGQTGRVATEVSRAQVAAWALAEALAKAAPTGAMPPDPRWSDLTAWLHANLHLPLNREEVARRAGLAPSRLHDWCLERCGRSPMRHLAHLRVGRAQELLLTTDLTLQEIAQLAGYSSPWWFSRAFRAATGTPPSAWRQTNRR